MPGLSSPLLSGSGLCTCNCTTAGRANTTVIRTRGTAPSSPGILQIQEYHDHGVLGTRAVPRIPFESLKVSAIHNSTWLRLPLACCYYLLSSRYCNTLSPIQLNRSAPHHKRSITPLIGFSDAASCTYRGKQGPCYRTARLCTVRPGCKSV